MSRIPLLVLLCVFAFPYFGYSQFGNESPIPYFRYSATAGFGPTQLYGDLDNKQIGGGVYLKGNYFLTHGVSIGLELQQGLLRGADSVATDGRVRDATNLYHAAVFGVRFQPIKFMQDDHLRRIEYRQSFGRRTLNSVYIGAGMGVLYSLQWDMTRVYGNVPSTDAQGNDIVVQNVLPAHRGNNYGLSYIVSTNVGFELPLHRLKPDLLDSYVWNLLVNAQVNFSLDDELDGYSGDYPGNENNDAFSMLSVGINLRF